MSSPIIDYKLYPPQAFGLKTIANEILYGGAAGGGKSHFIRVASIIYSLNIPGLVTYLFRRTFKEVISNHINTPGGYLELLKPLIDAGEVVYSKSDYTIRFANGSLIQLAHCQHENDVYNYQGAQIGFLILDEATHFTPFMYRYLRGRLRLGSMQVPQEFTGMFPRILNASNPGGVGHHYFKSNFVDFGERTLHRAPDDDGGMLRIYIPSKLADNKVLLMNDPDYAKRLGGLGDANIVNAMLNGDWDVITIGGFSGEWKPAYHVVEPFTIPPSWEITHGYDYGSSNPAAYLIFAESDGEEFQLADGSIGWVPAGSIFIISELYFANAKLEGLRLTGSQMAERIISHQIDNNLYGKVNAGPADTAIFSNEPGVQSVAHQMEEKGVRFLRGNKSPGSRVHGVSIIKQMLLNATSRPMEHAGLFVFKTCHNVIRTLPNLESDPNKVEDIDTNQEDHLYDVLRYKCLQSANRIGYGDVHGT